MDGIRRTHIHVFNANDVEMFTYEGLIRTISFYTPIFGSTLTQHMHTNYKCLVDSEHVEKLEINKRSKQEEEVGHLSGINYEL